MRSVQSRSRWLGEPDRPAWETAPPGAEQRRTQPPPQATDQAQPEQSEVIGLKTMISSCMDWRWLSASGCSALTGRPSRQRPARSPSQPTIWVRSTEPAWRHVRHDSGSRKPWPHSVCTERWAEEASETGENLSRSCEASQTLSHRSKLQYYLLVGLTTRGVKAGAGNDALGA